MDTLSSALRKSARSYPDLNAIVSASGAITFRELDQRVDRLAAGLLQLGVSRGDNVALWLPNCQEWIELFCACARIGAVTVPVNIRYKAEEAAYVISHSDAKLLVIAHQSGGTDYYEALISVAPELANQEQEAGALQLTAMSQLRTVVVVGDDRLRGTIPFAEVAGDPATARAAEAETAVSDLLLICYTSGTTGRPKGVMHDHTVLVQARKVGEASDLAPGGVVLGHMPFCHVGGMIMAIIPAIVIGASIAPMAKWDAGEALDLIERLGVTAFVGVPTHYQDLTAAADSRPRDTSSWRTGVIGGTTIMEATFESMKRKLGLQWLLSTYGMTENTLCTTLNRKDDPIEYCCSNTAPILADCEVIVVDPDTHQRLNANEEGEIWCRGTTVMRGYYKNPEATAQAITQEGWLRTGDLGRFNEAGYLTVTGRIKDLLRIGGINTSPMEIEQYLVRHPAVAAAAVVAAPDPRLGEVAFAFVQLKNGLTASADQLTVFCREGLAKYKVPKGFVFLEEFPKTDTGKIKKSDLSKMACDLLK